MIGSIRVGRTFLLTNNLVIGIEARRCRITERLIECETFPRRIFQFSHTGDLILLRSSYSVLRTCTGARTQA
jgi:hypothetical protein